MAKINQAVYQLFTVLFILLFAVGCTNNVAHNAASNKVAAAKSTQVRTQPQSQPQVIVLNKPRKTAGVVSNRNNRGSVDKRVNRRQAKDKHHVEYDKKRMWYNQQWLVQQEAEERQRIQRLQYRQRYEEKLREQEQLKKQRQAQVRWEQGQQRQQSQVINANIRQQVAAVSQYQQRQAQIEASQQQHNWRQDGGWDQAKIQAQAQAQQQKAQQQRIRQQHQQRWQYQQRLQQQRAQQQRSQRQRVARAWHGANLAEQLSNAAIARTYHKVRYDGRYIPISYPMGDVPANMGVCTDTLIRSYRRLGIDLQQLVHEDISRAFHVYPNLPKWGLSAPDPNIDHRRVHNLKVFFARHGQRLPVTNNPADYRPGDIVTWHLGGDQEHIGLVVNRRSPEDPRRHMIVHNIAKGDRMEDILFKLPITGHYRYLPNRSRWMASR